MKRKTDPIADSVSAHITPVGGNVFADLGFSPAEAKALQAQVKQVIAKKMAIKKQLMDSLADLHISTHRGRHFRLIVDAISA